MALKVFIVAGEASADMHAANLLRELKKLQPELISFGVGGKALAEAGTEVILPSSNLNVVGGLDWIDKAGEVIAGYRHTLEEIQKRKPDLAILLDLPDFNLMLAKHLKKMGVPIAYYISPQVWAWRKYRVRQIRRDVDLMLVLFPFEKEFYDKEGIVSHFVGHPLLENLKARNEFRNQNDVLKSPRIALLPGSRKSELRYHAPILQELVVNLRKRYPEAKFSVPVASTLARSEVIEAIGLQDIDYIEGNSHECLRWADVAVVASGTATLETALIGTPFCLYYRVAFTSAWAFKLFIRYKNFIGMPNLLHGKEVAKEFFQDAADPENLYAEVVKMVEEQDYRNAVAKQLLACRDYLGTTGASQRAANFISELIQMHKSKFHHA